MPRCSIREKLIIEAEIRAAAHLMTTHLAARSFSIRALKTESVNVATDRKAAYCSNGAEAAYDLPKIEVIKKSQKKDSSDAPRRAAARYRSRRFLMFLLTRSTDFSP